MVILFCEHFVFLMIESDCNVIWVVIWGVSCVFPVKTYRRAVSIEHGSIAILKYISSALVSLGLFCVGSVRAGTLC